MEHDLFFPMARPGTVGQEFSALLFEARLCLREFCRRELAEKGAQGHGARGCPPPQVIAFAKNHKHFATAPGTIQEYADAICAAAQRYGAAVAGFCKEFEPIAQPDAKPLASADASRLCETMGTYRNEARLALSCIHSAVASMSVAGNAIWDSIGLQYICAPHPCDDWEQQGQQPILHSHGDATSQATIERLNSEINGLREELKKCQEELNKAPRAAPEPQRPGQKPK
jgi:hypothetical protein